ncbi:MAG: arginyltransferase [Alphaproteobacteria bacterium]|jgi:leucyl-tRNA---protein transferase|nr:arginyltransferase [Alphaproteobacteria bacterium]
MKHSPIHDTRFFFSTAPLPCPYLPNRFERRVVTELLGRDAIALHDGLSAAGFRRSHNIAYAPACPDCQACQAVRTLANSFKMSRSQQRIWKRNSDLEVEVISPRATLEQFELFVTYQESRHSGGDMSNMDYRDYQSLVEDTPVETQLVEFRQADQTLVAACLMDRVDTGLSAVYSFFEPSLSQRSLGSYMILWLIEKARAQGLDHVYLGFWIDECAKMSYKAKFQPLEIWTVDDWQLFSSSNGEAF